MSSKNIDYQQLAEQIRIWASELGFARVGIAATDLAAEEGYLQHYLDAGYYAQMEFFPKHGQLRCRPADLVPGTLRVLSLCMDYLPPNAAMRATLADKNKAYISRYALGRDYHKLMRKRLQQLAQLIAGSVGELGYRVFVDSAPVLETALARNAGLGWLGKHTLLLQRDGGSYFFLGEIFVDIPLPVDEPLAKGHCGSCSSCLDVCPTSAFVRPYVLDAGRCISYLTIEHKGSIPVELRALMGNRVFGCDDCQLVCPWNSFARTSGEVDFLPRQHLDNISLVELFAWTEEEFLQRTQGSPLRRAGYINWLRNLAVGLGNAPSSILVLEALKARLNHPDELVREHVAWALQQHS